MKRWVAIILLSLYTFGATEACQLLKLPFLINHYLEHNSNKNALSFIDFIKLHYNDQHAYSADAHKHSKLPFKSIELGCIVGVTVIPVSEISLQAPLHHFITIPYGNYHSGDYILTPVGDIFQPPKA